MSKKPTPSAPGTREFEQEQTRFVKIHRYFLALWNDKRRKYPNWVELAAALEEAVTTVKRSVARMRDEWKLPIDRCPERGGGIGYTEAVTHFPLFTISQRQAAMLGLAQQLMALLDGTPMYDDFKDVLRKAFASMPEDFSQIFDQFRGAVSFHTKGQAAPVLFDWELFSTGIRAVVEQGELEIEHCSAKKGAKPRKVVVHPRHLANINHAWYLFFDVPGSDEPPMKYALSRIRSAKRTGRTFHPTRLFDIHVELGPGLGAYNKKDTHRVHVRFTDEAAPYILERKWHDTQVTTENSDGTVDVTMQVCVAPELDNILLPWAGKMRVLGPELLRERFRGIGEALARDHS